MSCAKQRLKANKPESQSLFSVINDLFHLLMMVVGL